MSAGAQRDGASRAGLYERLVGEGWGELEEPVRRLHLCAQGEGRFAVRRGEGRLARAVARLLGLPRNGEAVPLLLSVEPCGAGGERWRRNFAGREFVTEQGEHAGAWERAAEGGVNVCVSVTGPLISYGGLVRMKEAEG